MRRNQISGNIATSLYDIVFLMSLGFFALFMIALVYVNPQGKVGKVNRPAEFLITVTWPADMDVDIDTWMQDPNGVLISFNEKAPEGSPVFLDRDDRGVKRDTVLANGVEIPVDGNEEQMTIRGKIPGHYILNLHYYANHSNKPLDVPVMVKIQKLNPKVVTIFQTDTPIILHKPTEEVTVLHMDLDSDANVVDKKQGPFISLVDKQIEIITTPGASSPSAGGT